MIDCTKGIYGADHEAPFTISDQKFMSVDQYAVYQRAKIAGDEKSAILALSTIDGDILQPLADSIKKKNKVWIKKYRAVYTQAIQAKFSQNPDLRRQLIESTDEFGQVFMTDAEIRAEILAAGFTLPPNFRGMHIRNPHLTMYADILTKTRTLFQQSR